MGILKHIYLFIRAVLTLISCIPVIVANNRTVQFALLALITIAAGVLVSNRL